MSRDLFGNDPFFRQSGAMFEDMDRMHQQMMSGFGMPSMFGGHQMIGGGNHPSGHQQQLNRRDPFAGGGMMMGGSMFGNMDQMMRQMQSNPSGGYSSSSSTFTSYSSEGNGQQPKYYEARSESHNGPNGVRQERKSERNSETGVDRMSLGRHIYDRGHVTERSRNRFTNEREEKDDFINMEEDDKEGFQSEWRERSNYQQPQQQRHHRHTIQGRQEDVYHHNHSRRHHGSRDINFDKA